MNSEQPDSMNDLLQMLKQMVDFIRLDEHDALAFVWQEHCLVTKVSFISLVMSSKPI